MALYLIFHHRIQFLALLFFILMIIFYSILIKTQNLNYPDIISQGYYPDSYNFNISCFFNNNCDISCMTSNT